MPKRWLVLLLAVAATTGCGKAFMSSMLGYSDEWQALPSRVGPGLVAQMQAPIPDVPMPIGFRPVVARSSSSFDEYARHVKHVYQGKASSAEVIRFYQRRLPNDNWQFVDMQEDTVGAAVLNFVKGPEQLRLRIHRQFRVTTVIVNIQPQQPAGIMQ